MIVAAFERIALIGDPGGIQELLAVVDGRAVGCLVGARIRPQYLAALRQLSDAIGVPLLEQPLPTDADYADFVAAFRRLRPDLALCNSYSMVIRRDVLDAVGGRAINVHSSLLPKNRGPNPIQWALIRGEAKTGVTMHYMIEDVDAGDVIAQTEVDINDSDTWVTLTERVSVARSQLLCGELPVVLLGVNGRHAQNRGAVTTNRRLHPKSPRIDFDAMTDRQIYDLIRAQVHPLGGAYVIKAGEPVHFRTVVALSEIPALRARYGAGVGHAPGALETPSHG
jgi:methionyl-tRNA formyltransferase